MVIARSRWKWLWDWLINAGARWVLGLISLAMVASLLATLWQLHRELVLGQPTPNPSWYVQRLQLETLRLRLAMGSYRYQIGGVTAPEIRQRFEGLMALMEILQRDSIAGVKFRQVPAVRDHLYRAMTVLTDIDTRLPAFLADPDAEFVAIRREFVQLHNIWQQLTAAVLTHFGEETRAKQVRDRALYRQAQLTLAIGICCTALLVMMSLVQLSRTRRLSEGLEVLVAERTDDLTRALDEVSRSHDHLQLIDAKQRLILASIEDGLYGVDSQGRCSFCNPAAAHLLGQDDPQTLLGIPMDALVLGRRGVVGDMMDGPTYQLVMPRRRDHAVFYRLDGTTFPVEYRAYPMVQDHASVGAVVVFRNIQDRLDQESRKVQQQKLETVGQLSGGIAHDFNNLLTVILGNLALLDLDLPSTDDPEADAERHLLLDEARAAGQDGVELTRRLLTFARKQPIRREHADLVPFLERFTRMVRRTLPENIEVRWRCADGLAIWGDTSLLENTLLNLSINAQHAMPHGGSLLFDAQTVAVASCEHSVDERLQAGDYICLAVIDTGVGMSAEVMAHACDPFFSTKGGKGSGLGLSSACAFAEQSGGLLRLQSQLHKGTRVELYLPAAQARAVDHEAPAEAVPLLRGNECVLVVEDKDPVRRIAKRSLEQLGYQVLQAANAIEAMSLLSQENQIDAVFSDIVMPGGMSGRQLADWVRVCRPEVRVLLTTGFTQDDTTWQTDGLGVPLLRKPYDLAELAKRLREILDAATVSVELTGAQGWTTPRHR